MENKIRPLLKSIFGLAGWLLIVASLFSLGHMVVDEFTKDPKIIFKHYNILSQSLRVVDTIAGAFFCFLMRASMHLLEKRDIETLDSATKIFNVTLVAFVLKGLVPYTYIGEMINYQLTQACDLGLCDGLWGNTIFLLKVSIQPITKSLTNFIFALSIYVLFKQLKSFIIFESEVA